MPLPGKPAAQIADELLGVGAIGQGAAVGAERAHRLDVGGDLAGVAHRLRIIGGKDELRKRKLLKAELHPIGAPFGRVIGAGPTGDIVEQPLIEIVVKRLCRPPAVARDRGRGPFIALLEARGCGRDSGRCRRRNARTAMAFKNPTPKTEEMYFKSINTSVDQYRAFLEELRTDSLQLSNMDLDTRKTTKAAEYTLTDDSYAKLLAKLSERKFDGTSPELRPNILDFYSDLSAPIETKKDTVRWQSVLASLAQLKALTPVPVSVSSPPGLISPAPTR